MKISVYVDSRRTDKSGRKQILIRCYQSKEQVDYISTGIKCVHQPDGFVFPKEEPNGKVKGLRLMEIFTKCEEFLYRNPRMPRQKLKDSLKEIITGKKKDRNTISEMFNKYIEDKYDGTKKIYDRTLKKILEFDSSANFDTIDKKWLEKFESWLSRDGANVNGISIHMRNLRAIFNFAIDEDVTNNYPFRKFKIKHEQTGKRDLTVEQIRKLRDYPCNGTSREYRDMFMLIFYLCGINIGDLLMLTKNNVKNGRIEYHRRKTNKYYSIKIEPEAQEIINRYSGKEWLLSPLDTNKDYHTYLRRMNQQLKKIGMEYKDGIGYSGDALFPNLSTYYARHSWASIAAEADVPMDVISQALGHSTPYTTTDVYVNRRIKKIDEANRTVIDFINHQSKKTKRVN